MQLGIDYIGVSVIFICHDGEGNYLLAQRSKNCRDEHGTWDFGGGKLEFGLSAQDTIRQEVKEEYCAECKKIDFLGYRDVFREQQGKKTHWVGLDFHVLVDPSQVRNGEPHKFDAIGWFTLDELPSPLHSQVKRTVAMLKGKLAHQKE